MKRQTPFRAGLLVLVLAGGLLAACGDDDDSTDADDATDNDTSEDAATEAGDLEGGTLVLYSGRNEDLIQPLVDQFEEETGISVEVNYDDSDELALLIDTEGDRSPADVFLSQSPGAVGFLAERDRLSELPDDVLSQVEEDDAAADGTWVGVSGRIRTLVYNTDQVDEAELPDSVLDLTGDEWDGRVGLAPGNGSFQDFVTVLRTQLGEDEAEAWLEGMDDNGASAYENNTAIVEAVSRGEVDVGLVNHYYLFAVKDEDPATPAENHFFPSGDYGSAMLSTAVSILDSAESTDEAIAFVEYLLSEAGQTYFAEETFEYPLASDIEPDEALPPLDEIEVTRVDFSTLGGELEESVDMIEESGLNG